MIDITETSISNIEEIQEEKTQLEKVRDTSKRAMTFFDEELFHEAEIQTTDPSKDFDITHNHKIGTGGFGKVFKVKRRSDDKVCALKFCNPRSEQEKNLLINEIGLMNHCRNNENVLKIFKSYDYRDRIWIFLELMDVDLTSFITTH